MASNIVLSFSFLLSLFGPVWTCKPVSVGSIVNCVSLLSQPRILQFTLPNHCNYSKSEMLSQLTCFLYTYQSTSFTIFYWLFCIHCWLFWHHIDKNIYWHERTVSWTWSGVESKKNSFLQTFIIFRLKEHVCWSKDKFRILKLSHIMENNLEQ